MSGFNERLVNVYFPSVPIAMKRKINLVNEEHESEDEEPRIKDVLSHLSQAVSENLLNCCIVWPLPKIFYSGLPADNYFEIHS